jgi:hypothetical protein
LKLGQSNSIRGLGFANMFSLRNVAEFRTYTSSAISVPSDDLLVNARAVKISIYTQIPYFED